MKTRVPISLFVCLCIVATSYGQGTVNFTFDGPPPQPPGTASTVTQYYESGMLFKPLPGSFFGRIGSSPTSFRPDNGTAYLQAAFGDSLMFSPTNGSLFGVVSVDLAEYSTVVPDARTVSFFGYRFDGSIVTTNFTTDGIIDGTGPVVDFQTFYFGSEFTNLIRVEIPTSGWSLDNVTLQVSQIIPTPSLNISRSGSNVVVTWIVPSQNFILQENPDLTTTIWVDVTNVPTLNPNPKKLQNEVVLPLSFTNNRFYRLKLSP